MEFVLKFLAPNLLEIDQQRKDGRRHEAECENGHLHEAMMGARSQQVARLAIEPVL